MSDLVERDIYEVANQLGGYVSSATEKHLAAFLLREADEAGKLADRITALEKQNAELRKALEAIIDRSHNGELGTSKVIDMRKIAESARPRKPTEAEGREG